MFWFKTAALKLTRHKHCQFWSSNGGPSAWRDLLHVLCAVFWFSDKLTGHNAELLRKPFIDGKHGLDIEKIRIPNCLVFKLAEYCRLSSKAYLSMKSGVKGDNDLFVFFKNNYFSFRYNFNIIIYLLRKITDIFL